VIGSPLQYVLLLTRDAVASINRWSVREPMGQMIKAIENELVAVHDRSFP